MFDRLEDLVIRYQEVMGELQEPDVANDPERFRKLMKEQSDLAPIVEAYQEYKNCKQNVEESLMILRKKKNLKFLLQFFNSGFRFIQLFFCKLTHLFI